MARKKQDKHEIEDFDPPPVLIHLLFGEVNDDSAFDICAWILQANLMPESEKPKQLSLMINSPGGELASAFAIIEMMRGSSIPVSTVALGQIASAGLMIFMSGEQGQRIITPTCSIMSHNYSTGIIGDHHALVNIRRELDRNHQRMLDLYRRCTGLDDSVIESRLLGPQDCYLNPEEAVELKLGDVIKEV